MEKLQKIYRMHRLLKARRYPASSNVLQDELECSRATVIRIIRDLRLYYDAPIAYDRKRNGYFYDAEGFELPGLWFSQEELLALLTLQRLVDCAQPGLMDVQLSPLKKKIEKILDAEHLGSGELTKRVKILRMAGRTIPLRNFQVVTTALVERRRLFILYSSRESGEDSERDISPQRLVHYRDNWYLDAFCHLRDALRSFSVERVKDAKILDEDCLDIPERNLDEHFASSYGIFAGKPENFAVLRFTPERSRWVSEEKWHPEQQGRFLENGSFELKIPYSDPTELVMDILKHGPEVEVVSPEPLRQEVMSRILAAFEKYR